MRGALFLVAPRYPCGYAFRYAVYEDDRGDMRWIYVDERITSGTVSGVTHIDRSGYMTGKVVNDEEAEELTGLRVPAAHDRLREMVHDSTFHFAATVGGLFGQEVPAT